MASSPSDDALYGSEKDASSPMSGTPEEVSPSVDESPIDETPEEREARMSEMSVELEKVEAEITMLRQVLGSKIRHATELKRKLGITPFQEFKHELQTGIQQIKSTDSYQKTSAVVKTASEKTSSAFSSVGQVMAKKMGDIKNSQTFKSFDEKVHTTYASVKAKVTGSRSSSEIDEAFRDAQNNQDTEATTPASEGSEDYSPVLAEEKIPL